MNVAQYVAGFLIEKRVGHVFGYQGGAILKLVDEMVATGRIRFVQNYHEQGSAFCADAYARITGNLGVALATSGPGATNLITGIANAQLDSIPTLFITGQDYVANITNDNGARQNGFQDLNIANVVRSITKYSALVTEARRMRYELEKAWWHATSGRPGAVLLDIPIDVQFAEIDPATLEGFEPPVEGAPAPFDTSAVLALMRGARRPLILVGGGTRIANAAEEVREFVRASGIPVISTLNGVDVVEGNYGFAGLYGNTAANLAAQNADLMLVLGARLGQRQVGKMPEKYTSARIVHVDIDIKELKRIYPDELAIQGDLRSFLRTLNADLARSAAVRPLPDWRAWHERIGAWAVRYKSNVHVNTEGLDPVRVVEEILPLVGPDTIFTNDVGQNQMWTAQAFRVRTGQRFLNSVGLGAMGYSLPAAIGAQFANPDANVVAFMGDGGLQINIQELMLIGHLRLGIKCVVFNNKTLGMIREVQIRYYKANYHGANPGEFSCVDLEKLAGTYGMGYRRIDRLEDVAAAASAFASTEPCIIEVTVDLDSKVTNRYDEAECFEKERIDD